jgi:hypothetical protein
MHLGLWTLQTHSLTNQIFHQKQEEKESFSLLMGADTKEPCLEQKDLVKVSLSSRLE